MPTKKSPLEESHSSQVATVRENLANYRQAMLQLLQSTGCDVITLGDDRVIRKTEVVTSKRITEVLMMAVLKDLVSSIGPQGTRDELEAFGLGKIILQRHVDRVIAGANVYRSSSREAKRRSRSGAELNIGGPELVTETMRAVAEAYWEAIGQQTSLAAVGKRLKAEREAKKAERVMQQQEEDVQGSDLGPHEEAPAVAPQLALGPEAVREEALSPPEPQSAPKESVAAPRAEEEACEPEPPTLAKGGIGEAKVNALLSARRKARSSIPKRTAQRILQAALSVMLRRPGPLVWSPHLEHELAELVHSFFF